MQNDNYRGPDPPEVTDEKLSPNEDNKMALTDDGTKVKFTNANSYGMEENRNCDAKVDIETVQIAFAGMGKEELMKFANDPFWVRLRWILFILFWVAWIAMLAGAIIIIVLAPRCAPLPTLEWWQKNVIYRVDPISFQDSNGDGKGDLQGIESRLDHFEFLGVKTILLDSIYKTPNGDNTKDNFIEIDPVFGSLEDFEKLLESMKEKDLKLIMDFVPTYTTKNSSWFQKSRLRESPYDDFYIWANGTKLNIADPPNSEGTANGEPAWKYDPDRKQYYHYFANEDQPKLNLRNPNVSEIIKEAMISWLKRGVDGFRLSIADYLFEDSNGNEELTTDISESATTDHLHHNNSHHEHSNEGPKVILEHNEKEKLLSEWRSILDNYKEEHGGDHKLLLIEGYANPVPEQGMMNASVNSTDSLDLLSLVPTLDFTFFKSSWHLWALGSSTVQRITSRTEPELIDSFHMITMLMKGTPITYYGEEIGMQNILPSDVEKYSEIQVGSAIDYVQRSPMQWNNDTNAGFTNSSKPWLPVNPNYRDINVKNQMATPHSHIKIYQKLVKLRDDPAVQFGKMDVFKRPGDKVLSFTRVKKGKPGYVVLINFGDGLQTVDLSRYSKADSFKFPDDGTVEVRSSNIPDNSTLYKVGSAKVKLNNLQLGAKEGVVIKFVPNFGG